LLFNKLLKFRYL